MARSEKYWADRAAQQMWDYMQDAEKTADEVEKLYFNSTRYLQKTIDGIFTKYMTKHGLTEKEAKELIGRLYDKTSIRELLQKLQAAEQTEERKKYLREVEAPAYQARIQRLEALQEQIDLIMQNIYQQEKKISTRHYTGLAEKAYYHSVYNIQKRVGLGFYFAHVDQKQVDKAVNSQWSGQNYSTRIWRNTKKLAEDLKEELMVDLITGRTEREAADILAKKFAQGASNARRLIRTESCFLSNQLEMQSYKECGIEKFRYLATLDLRTSEICRGLDGKVFLVSEAQQGKNCPPMHPWCRSTTVAVVSEEAFQRMQRRARDPVTGKTYLVPASMNYQEWYAKYVEGNIEAEAQAKASKNTSSDQKQFDQYREILEDDMPKSFADFQNLKYNEPEKWEKLKALKHYLESNPENSSRDYHVQTALKEAGIKGIAKVNPVKLDVSSYSYDTEHINTERAHMVSREEAERFIKEADLSLTRWNGRFVNYYSKDGATYVDVENKNIRTAFTKKEFDENTLKIREVTEKYARKNSHVPDIKKAD